MDEPVSDSREASEGPLSAVSDVSQRDLQTAADPVA